MVFKKKYISESSVHKVPTLDKKYKSSHILDGHKRKKNNLRLLNYFFTFFNLTKSKLGAFEVPLFKIKQKYFYNKEKKI